MPDIAPLLPIGPVPQAPTGGAGLSPVAPLAAPGAMTDFLGQLAAALKSLANTASSRPSAAGRVQTPAQQAPTADSEPLPAGSDPAPEASDTDVDELPELLATLGIVVVPPALQPPVEAPADASADAPLDASAGAAPAAPASRLLEPSATTAASQPTTPQRVDRPRQSGGADETTPTPDGPMPPAADLPTPPAADLAARSTPGVPPLSTLDLPARPEANAAVPHGIPEVPPPSPAAAGPLQPRPATPDDTIAAVAAPPVVPERIPTSDHLESPSAGTASPVAVVQPRSRQGSALQSGDGSDSRRARSNKSIGAVESGAIDSTPSVGNDQTFSVVMAQAGAPSGAPVQAAAVRPSEVVSQIAHQAQLYRLPGNRGVRIQLHPEDLGGVQVTVRYAAGGGLELHINVEHAATGALVQQGWTELRDALATQGISPDRLVMSVSGPNNAAQPDFSSSGGSYRPDAGLAQFGQGGQSDRQHQDGADGGRFSRSWNGRSELTSATDDGTRVATSAAASRIDYRV